MYEHLVTTVHNNTRYEFLEMMIPRKMKVSECKSIIAKKIKQKESGNSSESSSSDESEESSSSSDSDSEASSTSS